MMQRVCVLLCCLAMIAAQSFNYETASHVLDIISIVQTSATSPVQASAFFYSRGGNTTNHLPWMRVLSDLKNNPTVKAFFLGSEAGSFDHAGRLLVPGSTTTFFDSVSTYNTSSGQCLVQFANMSCQRIYYAVDANGDYNNSVIQQVAYNHKSRAWYTSAKTRFAAAVSQNLVGDAIWQSAASWSLPSILSSTNLPGIYYYIPFSTCASCIQPFAASPLLCSACASVPPSTPVFSGALGADMGFSTLSSFLQARFPSPSQLVYLVHVSTGYLMGVSQNTPTSMTVNGAVTFLPATQSFMPLIAQTAQYLASKQWPATLVVFNNYYVQVVPTSIFAGQDIYIVVVMPAPVVNDYVDGSSTTASVIYGINIFSLVFLISALVILVWCRNYQVIRSSQFELTALFLLGAVGLNVSAIMLIGPNTDINCTVRAWLFNMTYTLCLAPLLAKNYWMHKIFNNIQLKTVKMSLLHCVAIVVLLLSIDGIILGAAQGTGTIGSFTQSIVGADGALAQHTYCASSPWFWGEFGFKILLLVIGCVLSFWLRNVDPAFSESRALMLVMYNGAGISLIVFFVQRISSLDAVSALLIQAIGIAWGAFFSTLALMGPRLFAIITLGDEGAIAAAEKEAEAEQRRTTRRASLTSKRPSLINTSAINTAVSELRFESSLHGPESMIELPTPSNAQSESTPTFASTEQIDASSVTVDVSQQS